MNIKHANKVAGTATKNNLPKYRVKKKIGSVISGFAFVL